MQEITAKEFNENSPLTDISDPRMIRTSEGVFLTSVSHLRLARSKDGLDFKIEKKPALFPENRYERFGVEDPRITQ